MNIPKDGSKWGSRGSHKSFRVLHTIELDGHMWVHYKEELSNQEYSCYVESFLTRFVETPQ
jgi:hypothetical protein